MDKLEQAKESYLSLVLIAWYNIDISSAFAEIGSNYLNS
jgi:hypothetical protein